jgi:branched-chain amino acid transport system substrate-binding protein
LLPTTAVGKVVLTQPVQLEDGSRRLLCLRAELDAQRNAGNEHGRMMMRGKILAALAVAAVAAATGWSSPAQTQEPKSVKIGYAISKTGPFAGGASITTLGAYLTWIKDINDAGGLKIAGKKVPIEVVEYDDRSNSEEMIKALERLINQDKVDFILPPWGTGFNLAAAPILNRGGYPHLGVTVTTNRAAELAQRFPNAVFLLGTPNEGVENLIKVLEKAKADKMIGDTIAMVSVSDQFGIELSTAAREGFKKAGFKVVYDKSYPIGTQDLQPVLKEAMDSKADSFVAFSYPPDTLGLTEQARILNYNPKVFYTAVGTAFPLFKQRFGANVEGVMGIGGINPDAPEFKDYVKRHTGANGGREPDRWANPVTYASLQMLQQAIERVGKVDRAAVIKELQTGTFDTIIGKIKLEKGLRMNSWQVGQWQNGEFYGVAPANLPGAKPVQLPKPAWKSGS